MDSQNDRSYKKIGRFFKRVTIGSFILVFFILSIKFFAVVFAITAVIGLFYIIGYGLEELYTSEEGLIIRNRIKAYFRNLTKGRKSGNQ